MTGSIFSLLRSTRKARRQTPAQTTKLQQARLAELVAFARAHSPYYRTLYRVLPAHVDDPRHIPVTNKKELMSRFDDWCTDRAITLERAQAFVADPEMIGEQFMGKYAVATTSGTTGVRGIFVLDEHNFSVTSALALRMLRDWLGVGALMRIVARGGRMGLVFATGAPFASAVAGARLKRRLGTAVETFSVYDPLPELVDQLNRFRPALFSSYASMIELLAGEQQAGRLRIDPVLIAVTAEGLPTKEYDRIAQIFGSKVGNSYACTECPFLSYSCEHEWLHVNADWAMLEPVDANFNPTPPGEQSYTVLLTNLANRVQPIIRYDLGDSVFQRPDPCPCGNPLPAIRVQGRTADMLTFTTKDGARVTIPPLVFATLVEHVAGIELFQIVQVSPTWLRVHLHFTDGADPDRVWHSVHAQLMRLLSEHRLADVAVTRAAEPPQRSQGGKVRLVIPLGE